MDNARVGTLLVLCSAAGFGTLGVLGIVAGNTGLSIPTILFLRFGLATVLLWAILGVRGELQLLSGRNLHMGISHWASATLG